MMNNMGFKNPRNLLFYLVFLSIFGIETNVPANATSYNEFRSLLNDIKVAVSEENSALALDLLSKAEKMLRELEKCPVLDKEALLWDMAQLNLDRADSMQNLEQRTYFANESVVRWQVYIEWYESLDETKLQIIKENPASFRIQRAVRQMGNAYMLRGNIDEYSIRDMFAFYGDLNPIYLSSQSVKLWRSWLFRCPAWKPVSNKSLRGLKEKFESDKDYCKEDWDDFYGFIEVWNTEQDLRPSNKRKYQRWLEDLKYSLGYDE